MNKILSMGLCAALDDSLPWELPCPIPFNLNKSNNMIALNSANAKIERARKIRLELKAKKKQKMVD